MVQFDMNLRSFAFFIAAAAVGNVVTQSRACMMLPPAGSGADSLSVIDEEALIVWDAANQVQYFVRRATFRAKVDNFAFLVPTPTEPELADAEDGVFNALAEMVKPQVITKKRYAFQPVLLLALPFTSRVPHTFTDVSSELELAEPRVEVLHQQKVAGYDATVLRANDAQSLLGWLNENGFAFEPRIGDWLEPYVEKEWVVTAFKYAKSDGAHPVSLSTKAVRMTFGAEKPFFPYREPSEQGQRAGHERSLRIFFVGDTRIEGRLGMPGLEWPASTRFAAKRDGLSLILARALPPGVLADGHSYWLTEALDLSSVRQGDGADLFFHASPETRELTPPPIIRYSGTIGIPIVLDVVYMVPLIGFAVRRFRRRSVRRVATAG